MCVCVYVCVCVYIYLFKYQSSRLNPLLGLRVGWGDPVL